LRKIATPGPHLDAGALHVNLHLTKFAVEQVRVDVEAESVGDGASPIASLTAPVRSLVLVNAATALLSCSIPLGVPRSWTRSTRFVWSSIPQP
jgi:hypothetical protein